SEGLGLIDCVTTLGREKVTRQAAACISPEAIAVLGAAGPEPPAQFQGYEIHMGETRLGPNCRPFLSLTRAGDDLVANDGAVTADGRVIGTYLHGLFDSGEGGRWLLNYLSKLCHKDLTPVREQPGSCIEEQYDRLAGHFRRHLRMDAIYQALGVTR